MQESREPVKERHSVREKMPMKERPSKEDGQMQTARTVRCKKWKISGPSVVSL